MLKYFLIYIMLISFFNGFSQVSLSWSAMYSNGNNDTYLEATDMAINDSGYVFVTGASIDTITGYDIVTIKYDASGNQKWLQRFDYQNSFQRPMAMHIDSLNNIYICGMQSSYNDSMLVLKYNSSGILQWNRFFGTGSYNIAFDVTADDSGYVYITGNSNNSTFTTIKYDKNGNEKWKAFNPNPSGGVANSFITLDANRNIYIAVRANGTMWSCNTIKYNNSGIKQWEQAYIGGGSTFGAAPTGIKVDKNGDILVLAQDETCGFVVVKYAQNGGTHWISCFDEKTTYGGTGAINRSMAMTVDNFGNVCATGGHNPSNHGEVYATVKFNSIGSLMWSKIYPDSINYGNYLAYGMAVDKYGFIYITGQGNSVPNDIDLISIKYDSNGNQVWKARYLSNESEMGVKIAVNNKNGDVYCLGQQFLSTGNRKLITIKYGQTFTGISEIKKETSWGVYPNPVSDILYFQSEQNEFQNSEIEIANCLGQIILRLPFQKAVDVSHLINGYYSLKIITSSKKEYYSKFIKNEN